MGDANLGAPSTEQQVPGADPARLRAIRHHLAAFLPGALLDRFWHEGFAAVRQPSFRLNALRLAGGSSSCGRDTADGSRREGGHSCGNSDNGGDGGCYDGTVRQLLAGFGLPTDTLVERCPYHPLARLLPARTAAAVRVAEQIHAPGALRSGAVYFMSLSSMLPALALMAYPAAALPPPPSPSPPQQQQHYHHHHHHSHSTDVRDRGIGSLAPVGGDGGNSGGGLRVLDLCAAPGGKTALLAELMGNRGTLLAVDSSWPRLQRLQFNLERLVPDNRHNYRTEDGDVSSCGSGGSDGDGVPRGETHAGAATSVGDWWRRGCVVAVHADGTRLRVDDHGLPYIVRRERGGVGGSGGDGGGARRRARSRHDVGQSDDDDEDDEGELGVYDRVLVDAPCSGLGRLQLGRPSSYSRWDELHVARHPERQRRLLLRGARLLRRGGSLLYGTCTLDPRENEAVVAWLLGQTGGRLRLVEPRLPAPYTPVAPQPPPNELEPQAGANTPAAAAAADMTYGPLPCTLRLAGRHPSPSSPASASLLLSSPSPPISVPLREALEAHRPGCTYPAMLDGPWWKEAIRAATGGQSSQRGRGGGGGGSVQGAAVGGSSSSSSRSSASVLWRLGGGSDWGSGADVSWASIREQIESCCVRVAPGSTYEGFFLAQFVKE